MLINPSAPVVAEQKPIVKNSAEINTVEEFLSTENIRIPEYQRPYKWTEKNVSQLLDDIITFSEPEVRYRIGTIVIHHNQQENTLDLVDGQQRFTTLRLLVYALHEKIEGNSNFEDSTKKMVENLVEKMDKVGVSYRHIASIENIRNNYALIKRSISRFNDKIIRKFIKEFEVVMFFITNETEAFQFFDSQNSRGKDLNPHDLLKAFHLREFDERDQEFQTRIVSTWENYQSDKLAQLFSRYLYRIIVWSENKRAFFFDKNKIGTFKGVNMESIESFPFIKMFQIAHFFVDDYNANIGRKIDKRKMDFPFQIDQLIINGRRFFEYVDYYLEINERFKNKYLHHKESTKSSHKLVNLVFDGNVFSYRTGERYIKELFECVMIFYIDKFGDKRLDEFIEKAFVWCYCLRFKYERLGFVSIDNYVVEYNLFAVIKNSLRPEEVLKYKIEKLPALEKVNECSAHGRRMDPDIIQFFKDNMYYEI